MISKLDTAAPLAGDLEKAYKLSKDHDKIEKVYMAMNSWNRNLKGDEMPHKAVIEEMIRDSKHEGPLESDADKRNPIKKCWNDDFPQETVKKLVTALGQINIDYLANKSEYEKIQKAVYNDPLLTSVMQGERLDQSTSAPSLGLSIKFA